MSDDPAPKTIRSRLVEKVREQLTSFKLSRLARAVKKQNLTYLSNDKLMRLECALRDVRRNGAAGSFVEFGVALGGSAILIAAAAKEKSYFTGFDVFGLIPEPTSPKDDEKSKGRYAVISSGASTGIGGEEYYGYRADLFGDVVVAFRRNGLIVDNKTIRLVKGLFQETWPKQNIRVIAFCHIDCDWYDPVKYCLDAVAPILARGGLIVLDDYYDYGGCKTATDEFLEMTPSFELLDGPNVVLRRRRM